DAEVDIEAQGAPGAAVLEGLRPGTAHVLRLVGRPIARFRTVDPPPGRLLYRFATLSDLHIGDRRFGALFHFGERRRPGQEPFPLRCARAALHEALAWGAQAVVVK